MNKEFKLCKTCLTNITNNDYCDACGHTFDPKETAIFITKGNFPRDFVWYGLLASVIFGFMSYFVIHTFFVGDFAMKKMGAALFFVLPLSCGATLAYFIRPIQNTFWRAFISFLIAVIFGALVYISNMSGLTYAKGLAAISVAPLYVGVLFGRLFRLWSARHLTARFQSSSLALVFLLPIVYGALEEQYFELTPVRAVETQVMIEAPPSVVWKTVRFYEHVDQDPPLILKLGLPIPLQAGGNHKQAGNITSCEYEGGGFIRKKSPSWSSKRS